MLVAAEDEDFAVLIAGGPVRGWRVTEGIETEAVLAMLRGLAAEVRTAFRPAAWLIIEDNNVVGLCSLLEPPIPGRELKIGYGVAPTRRGRGVAGRAIAELVVWARSHAHIDAITAETGTGNPASQRVLTANGFAQVGTRIDAEDGALQCWRIGVGAGSA